MAESDLTGKEVEFDDLQGIVRFGHGRLTDACMLLLQVKDAAMARQWLRGLAVSSAQAQTPRPEQALQVAFTAPGLLALGLDNNIVAGFSDEFVAGMTEPGRARRLGDVGANAPDSWRWGGTEPAMPHVLLMLYALPGQLDSWHEAVCSGDYGQAFRELQHFRANQHVSSEPFGFADGISQPDIDWSQNQSTDVHRRDDYSNLLAPGEVVLGYGNEYGEYTPRPLLDPTDSNAQLLPEAEDQPGLKDLGRNGSYLVFRQLEQDVPGFWQFINARAGNQAEKREKLAAAMVGRKRDGMPLVQLAPRVIDGISSKSQEKNNFNYDNDANGLACPIASHVRRSNPRTGDFPPPVNGLISRLLSMLGFAKGSREQDLVASTRYHRILRRGRQYGPVLSPEEALRGDEDSGEERGLHFICLGANLARQFEFVQNAWAVNGKFAGLQNEEDPLIGNRETLSGGTTKDNFNQPQLSGVRQCTSGMPQFVTVRGGAYFFLPGIRALQYITAEKHGEGS